MDNRFVADVLLYIRILKNFKNEYGIMKYYTKCIN